MSTFQLKNRVYFAGAAAGGGFHGFESGYAVHGLFDGARDGDFHLIDGGHAIVDTHHDFREIGGGEDGYGNGEGEIDAYRNQCDDDEIMDARSALSSARARRSTAGEIVDGSIMLL